MRYDLVVIGSDAAATSGAIAAAEMGRRVALIENAVPTADKANRALKPISTAVLRDAIVRLAGDDYALGPITMRELRRRVKLMADREAYATHDRLDRHEIDLYRGVARFVRPHDLVVHTVDGDAKLEADRVLIASGTKPLRPRSIPFDGRRVFDADEILALDSLPRSMIVVGAGPTGIERAMLLATLGVRVTVVDGGDRLFDGLDRDVVESLLAHAGELGMTFRLGAEVIGIELVEDDGVELFFANGQRMSGECVLYAAGRVGNTDTLDLAAAGLEADDRGRLWCDAEQRTWAAHIYGAGDVVGFPLLAGETAEQGRRAVCRAFGKPFQGGRFVRTEFLTTPIVAAIGRTEEQLVQDRIPHETGAIHLRSASTIVKPTDRAGFLKVLFHSVTRRLLAVHAIGDAARDVTRIAQSVMEADGTLLEFCRRASASSAVGGSCRGARVEGQAALRVDLPSNAGCPIVPHIGADSFEVTVPELAELVAV